MVDFVFNNSGAFLANFVKQLGHVSSPGETKALAAMLMKAIPDLPERIREDHFFPVEYMAMDDDELVEWFVGLLTIQMYAA